MSFIQGRTFLDEGDNGLLLSADGDYPNGMTDDFTVRLYDDEWDLLGEQTTNTTGSVGQYNFSVLPDEETYYVCGVDRAGYSHSPADEEQDVVKTDGTPAYPVYSYAEIVETGGS